MRFQVGGTAFQVVRIGGRDWAISILVGLVSLPVGTFVRLLPTEPIAQFLYKIRLYNDPAKLPTESVEAEEVVWNAGIAKSLDNLSHYARIRGGRLQGAFSHFRWFLAAPKTDSSLIPLAGSRVVLRSRNAQLKKKNIQPISLMAILPTIVASSVGAGWKPEANPGGLDGEVKGTDLSLLTKGISIHPDTDPSDPYYQRFGPKQQ